MVLKVGINGFGRVGRVVFRTCLERPDVEVCAINDPAIDINYICYLIKYDSTHGTLKGNVTHTDNEITVDDVQVKVYQEKFPTGIPWHTAGAEYIVEASGMFTNLDKASGHLVCDGVKRVIVTAPCVDVPMIILGVNEKKIRLSSKVISCGSSTLYCLAPIVKILEDNYGVEDGFITSIHAMTPSLKPLDGLCLKGKHWRDHRSITQNIIPAATGACKALGRIIPAVRDRMCGLAFRVPIANVSVLDLTVRLKKFTSLENIAGDIEKFNETTKNIIKTNSEEAVSSDFIGDSYSCIMDTTSSIQLKPNSFKIICWYENEYSYACRVIDLIIYSENQLMEYEARSSLTTGIEGQSLDEIQIESASIEKTKAKAITVNNRLPVSVKNQSQVRQKKPSGNPAISFNGDTEGRVMLCKIWNDEENVARHRPTSFFQACASFAPPIHESFCLQAQERLEYIKQDAICTRAQERLEKVKQEFSKMVNITESLLKKSHNSKLSLNTLESSNDIINKMKQEENVNITTLKAVENFTPNNASVNDITDTAMSTSTLSNKHFVNNNNSYVDTTENIMSENGKSDFSLMTVQSVKEMKNTVIQGDQKADISKSFVTKTFADIFKGIYELQRQVSTCSANVEQKEEFNENKNKSEDFHDTGENNDQAETRSLNITQNDTINEQLADSVVTNVETINQIGEKDVNESETNPQNDTQNESEHNQCNETNKNEPEHKQCHETNKNEPEHKQCNETNRNEPENNQCDETNKENTQDEQLDMEDDKQCCSEHARTAASDSSKHDDVQIVETSWAYAAKSELEVPAAWTPRPHYTNKQDIYDKLDSVSGSDNSFDVEKKKSEIINIRDITNSLEDLDRLDKICRIMEISDELSDNLLSALNKNSDEPNMSLAKKRWSFKDLCEKVNLDEFCNKVFGK